MSPRNRDRHPGGRPMDTPDEGDRPGRDTPDSPTGGPRLPEVDRGSWDDRSRGQEGHSRRVDLPGRGPSPSYARSDDRLKEEIRLRLAEDPQVDPAEIDVRVEKGVVQLSGRVHDRWMKYHLEELVGACQGVKDIQNELEVPRGNGRSLEAGGNDGKSLGDDSR